MTWWNLYINMDGKAWCPSFNHGGDRCSYSYPWCNIPLSKLHDLKYRINKQYINVKQIFQSMEPK